VPGKKQINNIINKVNAEEKKINKLTKQMSKTNIQRQKLNPYLETLLCPELNNGARVPGAFDKRSAYLHRHITLPMKTDSSGNAAIVFQPYAIYDNSITSTNSAIFVSGVNNGTAAGVYTPLASGSTFVSMPITYQITQNTISNFRIVSVSATIRPTTNLLNLSGVAYACINNLTNAATLAYSGAATTVNSDITASVVISNIENAVNSCMASFNTGEYPRLIYLPEDETDMFFYGLDVAGPGNVVTKEQFFVFAIQNLVSSTGSGSIPFQLDIYYNMELIAYPGSTLIGMESNNSTRGDYLPIVNTVRQKYNNHIARAMSGNSSIATT
jgi:hypothetical protein